MPKRDFYTSEWTCTVVDTLTGIRTECLEKQSSKKKAKSVAYAKLLARLQNVDRVEMSLFNQFFRKRKQLPGVILDQNSVKYATESMVLRRNYTKPVASTPAEPEYDGPDLYCLNCGYGGDYRSKTLLRCGGCKKVWFCDEMCLRQKWKEHKPDCKYVPKPRRVLKQVVDRFRSQTVLAKRRVRTWNSRQALQLLASKWRRVATRWGVDVLGPDRCAQCDGVSIGRDDLDDGCFYCLACWVEFNAKYREEEVSD